MKYLVNSASAVALAAAHMSDTCATVVITTENGPVVVNESDYLASDGKMKLASNKVMENTPEVVPENVIVPPTPSAPDFTSGNPAEPVPQQDVASTGAAVPAAPPPGAYAVVKIGKKFFVSDALGNKITDNSKVDHEKGYETDEAAWVAARDAQPH